MDPISAIGVATTAYNAIKRGFQVGKEIEGMLTEVGFSVIQPFWRNHAFIGALAVK